MDYYLDAPDLVQCEDCDSTVENSHSKRLSDGSRLVFALDGTPRLVYQYRILCSSCFDQYNPNL